MVGVVLLGHGHVASGLASALVMVAGEQEAFKVLDLIEAEAAVYGERVDEAITLLAQQCDGVVVLCDLVGGTPFNCAMVAAAKFEKVEVIAGVNLPMLIECVFNRANTDLASLCTLVLSAGVSGIANKTLRDTSSQDQGAVVQKHDGQGVLSVDDRSCALAKESIDGMSKSSAHSEEDGGI